MAKTQSGKQGFLDRLFGFLRDWLSQSKVEFRLIIENVRLKKEIRRKDEIIAERDARVQRLEKVEKDQLLGIIEEQRLQIQHLNELLFKCRGKFDTAERSQQ